MYDIISYIIKQMTTVTIYNRFSHIQRVGMGTEIELPLGVRDESIIVYDMNGSILPHTLREGRRIMMGDDYSSNPGPIIQVFKKDKTISGKLIRYTDSLVELIIPKDATRTIVREYDSIIIPHIHTTVHLDPTHDRDTIYRISYITDNLRWNCVGIANLSGNDNELRITLTLRGQIYNDTGISITGRTRLVAGKVQQGTSRKASGGMALMAASSGPQSDYSGLIEDYHVYDVGQHDVETNTETMIVELIRVPVCKIYQHYTGSEDTSFGYEFTVERFIPHCTVHVYNVDNEFIGTTNLNAVLEGETGYISVGTSELVKCITNVSSHTVDPSKENPKDSRRIFDEIAVTGLNLSESDIGLDIKHYIGDKTVVKAEPEEYKREKGYIIWSYRSPPGKGQETIKLEMQD
jgi:hypothetical protein